MSNDSGCSVSKMMPADWIICASSCVVSTWSTSGSPSMRKLRPLRFELLGRARHDGDDLQVLALDLQLLGQHRLQQRAEHRLRRAAGGKIGQQFREVLLRVLHPARAAGGEHAAAFRPAVLRSQELRAFFDHRQIGGERCVVDLVEAQALERGDDLAGGDLAGLAGRSTRPGPRARPAQSAQQPSCWDRPAGSRPHPPPTSASARRWGRRWRIARS